ncbi:MAG: ABC transporter permease [Dethiosulfovibrio peptidovorans]|nr:MAG: ABC transporter permease [Dethiosulfovibrio peptidovorans]
MYRRTLCPWLMAGVILLVVSPALGRYPLEIRDVLSGDPVASAIFFRIRVPRILAGLMVGASLASSGAAFQGLFRNPLASPGLLGASSGAAFGAALGIFLTLGTGTIELASFFGGLAAVIGTFFLGRRFAVGGTFGLILSGIMVSSLFSAAVSFLKFFADPTDTLPNIVFWLMGSLSSTDMNDVVRITLPVIAGLCLLWGSAWRVNVLSLGEAEAAALGLDVRLWRTAIIVGSTVLVASAVSISGVIGWVGLVVPHFVRFLVGPDFRLVIPWSGAFGGVFLLAADTVSRTAFPVEIPLGILTAMIGIPCFLILMGRKGGPLWR